jgi:dephospho-CoA kinase
MFSKRHKKVLLFTGSVAAGKSFICNQINKKKISYIDLDKVVNLIYEKNLDFKKKLLSINPSFIKNNKVNKNKIKNAISENPKLLDSLENSIYPILKNKLNLQLKNSNNLLFIIEVPLLFEKNFKINLPYRSINVFCSKVTHRKRLNSRFDQSKNLFKNIILKKHYSQEKKSYFSDELINSCNNSRLKKLLIEILLSKYLN